MRLSWLVITIAAAAILVAAGCSGSRVAADAATPEVALMLQTGMADGRMVYVGVGGAIDGQINPELEVESGSRVRITVTNGDVMAHDLAVPAFGAKTPIISAHGSEAEISFLVKEGQEGTYDYFCTIAGHRQAGMEGLLIVR
jgi:nitrite reductase (NO-forming)